MTRPVLPERHWVYLHLGADGLPLYIGCTTHRRRRLGDHKRLSAWWPLVSEVTYEGPFDHDYAFALEAELIGHLQPPNNVYGRTRKTAVPA